MATYGLEKITDQIIADAEAEAKSILDAAEKQCEEIRQEWRKKTDAMIEKYESDTNREGDQVIARAKSTAAMAKRNISLQNEADMLDETFRRAEKDIKSLPEDQYEKLLAGLLVQAIKDQYENEKAIISLDGDEVEIADTYEVILNHEDHERVGAQVIQDATQALALTLPKEVVSKIQLSEKEVATQGGLILKCGDVEMNCTIPVLMKQIRNEMEAEISRKLFR